MWPLILLGIGGVGYYFYKKSPTTTPSAYHPAILSLPANNVAVYDPGKSPTGGTPSSPIIQTSNGPQSGLPQYPFPSSAPASHHAPINVSAVPVMHLAITAPTYKFSDTSGDY